MLTRPDAAVPDSTPPRTPIRLLEPRPLRLPVQDRELVPQHEDSSSFDPGDRLQRTTSSNRRRTTKYASDHNMRDLHRTGKPTLPGHCLTDLPDRFFEPHASSMPRLVSRTAPLNCWTTPRRCSSTEV